MSTLLLLVQPLGVDSRLPCCSKCRCARADKEVLLHTWRAHAGHARDTQQPLSLCTRCNLPDAEGPIITAPSTTTGLL